ncbi:MAG: hypothetical protein Q9211_000807 [Gyalolechia sp. 1 TL-2023]
MMVGAANGDLGRHTQIGEQDGWPIPIITPRTKVFQKPFSSSINGNVAGLARTHQMADALGRIFQGRLIQTAVWFMVGIDFIWTIGFFFSNLLQCYPIKVNWTALGNLVGYCVDTNKLIVYQSWSDVATNDLQTPLVYWPMVESSVGIIGACLPLLRPLFAGATSHGFMRDLHSVDMPSSEGSAKLWDTSGSSGSTDGWNSTTSTFRWGSDSMPSTGNLTEKGLPSLPASSLNMLRDAPSEGPWMKRPVVQVDLV